MSLSLAISSWFAGRVDVGNVVELISVVITPVEPETIVDESCCILRSGILLGSKKRKNRCQRFEKGKFSRLCARKREDGIIVVGGRIPKSCDSSYDEQELILMPFDHRVRSRLYAERDQSRGHNGVSTTMSKIRTRFWILKLRKMARAIREQCVICRKKQKILES
jgi:hypothetical protein